MKRKLVIWALLFFGFIFNANAQNMHVAGFVVADNNYSAGIPFASVKLLDPKTNEILYSNMTTIYGWYDLGSIQTGRLYKLVVTSPISKKVTKLFKPKYIKVESNATNATNVTQHIAVPLNPGTQYLMPEHIYKVVDIRGSAKSLRELLNNIPGVKYEDGYLVGNDGSNCILSFDGDYVRSADYLESVLDSTEFAYIIEFEVYNIKDIEGTIYDKVYNLVLDQRIKKDHITTKGLNLSVDNGWFVE